MSWKSYLWDKFNEATDNKDWEKSLEIARAIQAQHDTGQQQQQSQNDTDTDNQSLGWWGRRTR